jgi:L-alanine-DL-glutamate epimerase-like enolase superfamily enzyme
VVAAAGPFVEYLPEELADSVLRRDLTIGTPAVQPDGTIALPTHPGLGIGLDHDVLDRCRVTGAGARRAETGR